MKTHIINFRNNLLKVSNIEFIKMSFIVAENIRTNEELIMPFKEVSIVAISDNNVWLNNDKNIFTLKNSCLEGIFSRNEILLNKNLISNDIAWISISDPNKENVNIEAKNKLSLKFSDIEEETDNEILFNQVFAKQIVDFINKNKDKKFIINCEAGISRSAAVALFLESFLGLETSVDKHIRFEPNMFIFNLLKQTLL